MLEAAAKNTREVKKRHLDRRRLGVVVEIRAVNHRGRVDGVVLGAGKEVDGLEAMGRLIDAPRG